MARVAIIGATGNVGTFAAHAISEIPYVSEILLCGRPGRESLLEGIMIDLIDSHAASGISKRMHWSTSLRDVAGSDIVIITSGLPRRADQDRAELALENAKIVGAVSAVIGEVAPRAKILVVTNPVDVMTSVALQRSGLPASQVFGLGTHLDSMRLKSLIAAHFNIHVSEVHTRIIGEHGETMVPLWSATTIGGIQVSNLPAFSRMPKEQMIEVVKASGSRIISKKGSTIFGPGEAIATLVRTSLGNENRILTVSAYIRSEVHGIGDVCIGVPARINRDGVFPVAIRIDDDEFIRFRESVEKMREITRTVLAAQPSG